MEEEPLTLAGFVKYYESMLAPELARIHQRFDHIDGRLDALLRHIKALHQRPDRHAD